MTEEIQNPAKPTKRFQHDSLDALIDMIRAAQPDPTRAMTGREAVTSIAKFVDQAVKRGVTVAQIVTILRSFHLNLSEATVRSYLAAAKAAADKKREDKETEKAARGAKALSAGRALPQQGATTAQGDRPRAQPAPVVERPVTDTHGAT